MGMMDTVFLQIAFGFLITNIFQSSSVTTGLVVVMSQNGLVTPAVAIPILLGANLGTPTTALLVAMRMNTSAKRAATAHFLFNFLGVLLFLPFLSLFTNLIISLGGDAGQQVANAHLIFNLTCCIVFLVLIGPFGRLVMRVVPGREDDVVFVTRHIQRPLPPATPDAVTMIEQEIGHVLDVSRKTPPGFDLLMTDPQKYSPQVSQLRDYARYLDAQISDAALELSARQLSAKDAAHLAGLVRISKLGQVLADQTGELVEIVHQIQERGITISLKHRRPRSSHSLVPCGMNLTHTCPGLPGYFRCSERTDAKTGRCPAGVRELPVPRVSPAVRVRQNPVGQRVLPGPVPDRGDGIDHPGDPEINAAAGPQLNPRYSIARHTLPIAGYPPFPASPAMLYTREVTGSWLRMNLPGAPHARTAEDVRNHPLNRAGRPDGH